MQIFAQERQNKIYEMLQKNGAVTTSGLVNCFGVSIETIRKDLLFMERKGQLSRVHGGAVIKSDMKRFLELQQRNKEYSAQKEALALKATEFISDGDIIGIDSGSTAIALAEAIKERFSRLTVVTHSHDVFETLCNYKDFTLILCGGQYQRSENAFYGALTLDTLSNLHMQKAFIFPSALSLNCGIFDYQNDLYQVQKQMIKSAETIYILADSSKFEKKALLKIDDMKTDYYYVTDASLSKELKKIYEENNINIFIGGRKKVIYDKIAEQTTDK